MAKKDSWDKKKNRRFRITSLPRCDSNTWSIEKKKDNVPR